MAKKQHDTPNMEIIEDGESESGPEDTSGIIIGN